MDARKGIYFVSDVHLGLDVGDPAGREAAVVAFLRAIPAESTRALYLLGDIWDFWYEYKDVVPRGYARVFAALQDLIDAGVEVGFFRGNHDMWCFSYFESLGIKVLEQPYLLEASGKVFCLGHGDGLGPGMRGYKLLRAVFRNRLAQRLFSTLHPRLAFALARRWSRGSRLARREAYVFRGEAEPLWQFCDAFSRTEKVDYFIFGHLHARADVTLPSGARLLVLKDWIDGPDYLYFDGISTASGHSMKIEK